MQDKGNLSTGEERSATALNNKQGSKKCDGKNWKPLPRGQTATEDPTVNVNSR